MQTRWHEGPPSSPFPSPGPAPLPSALPPRVLSTPSPPSVSLVFQTEEPNKEEFLLDPPCQLPGHRAPHGQLPGAGGASPGQAAAGLPGGHACCGQLCGRAPLPSSEGEARAQGVQGRGGSPRPCSQAWRPRPHSQDPALWGGTDWREGTLQESQGRRGANLPSRGHWFRPGGEQVPEWLNFGIYFKGPFYNPTINGKLTSLARNRK